MKRMLGRPGRLLLPMALAVCAAFSDAEKAAWLATAIICTRFYSLCAGAALRKAATRIVSASRLNGNYYLALVLGLWSAGFAFFILTPEGSDIMKIGLAGGLITTAQIASEGLYSIPDPISGLACDALIALYAAAGLMISKGNHMLLIASCGVCLVAAVALSIALRKKPGFTPGMQVIKSAPMAFLKTGIPVICIGMAFSGAHPAAVLAAWAVFEAMETPIRRNAQESHWLNIVCVLTGISGAAAAVFFHEYMAIGPAGAVFFLMIFSGALNVRTIFMLVCLMASMACGFEFMAHMTLITPRNIFVLMAGIFALAAAILCIPDYKTAYIRLRALAKKRKRV